MRRTLSSSLYRSESDGVDLTEQADESTVHHQLRNKPKELKSQRALIKRRTNNCIAPRPSRLITSLIFPNWARGSAPKRARWGESKKIKMGRIEM
jgi:hypothetical protein